jgi:hypothetical protein
MGNSVFDGMPEFPQIDTEERQRLAGCSRPFLENGDYNMLGQKLIRIETAGFLLGIRRKNALNTLRQTFEHITLPGWRILSGENT